jgi:dTDP-4-amino-4,6-dideoxygalactose transaminase
MTSRRVQIAAAYNQAFSDMDEVELPPDRADSSHCWHLYALRLNLNKLMIDRAEFVSQMRADGVSNSVHFIPIPLHPYYKRRLEMKDPCSLALNEYPRLVSLPLYPAMTDSDVTRVIEAVGTLARKSSKRTLFQLSA